MRLSLKWLLAFLATFAVLLLLHLPLLRLPYFWDEAGYYVPWALDFYRAGLMIPASIPPIGHTPLVMIYLGFAWHILGYSFLVTRSAILLLASGTVVAIYAVGQRVATREVAAWSAILLGLSPLFFAQSTLVHLDLAPALFTTLAVLFLLGDQLWLFALAASLAVLCKETSVVLLPVVWLYAWRKGCGSAAERRAPLATWAPLVSPLLPLAVWALYYHHVTGFWTGNREYLSYNLYTTLSPVRVFFSLLRRAYELFIGGFNWLLTACAMVGIWWGSKHRTLETGDGIQDSGETRNSKLETRLSSFDSPVLSAVPHLPSPVSRFPNFIFLAAGLVTIYLLLLSLVGGAVLPRYLLPALPLFYLGAVVLVTRLPRFPARLILAATAACFVWAWFINPPYPFPFEDNLAYADFIRLHEQAAHYLEAQPGQPRILTAWPATDELVKPVLGYVQKPLRVVAVQGFAPQDFANVPPESFDLLYLYSRHWEPPGNWVERFPAWLRIQGRYFDYHPQVAADALVAQHHLRLLAEMEQRGQWVRIYSH
jgi:4-amino-4-deoxy-L-arabinose transferase-like glycosyltransferase